MREGTAAATLIDDQDTDGSPGFLVVFNVIFERLGEGRGEFSAAAGARWWFFGLFLAHKNRREAKKYRKGSPFRSKLNRSKQFPHLTLRTEPPQADLRVTEDRFPAPNFLENSENRLTEMDQTSPFGLAQ